MQAVFKKRFHCAIATAFARMLRLSLIVFLVFTTTSPLTVFGADQEAGTLPYLYNISATSVAQTTATITWNSTFNATSQVFYGTTAQDNPGNYTYSTAATTTNTTVHSVPISTGITASTTFHYRVRSVGDIGGTLTSVLSEDYTFNTPAATPPSSGGGGGGGGGPAPTTKGIEKVGWYFSASGLTTTNIELTSADGKAKGLLTQHTTVTNATGKALNYITCYPPSGNVTPPAGKQIIAAYDFGPDGTRFNPAITIKITYDPAKLPDGVPEENLTLAYYDNATSAWTELSSMSIDTVNKVISGKTTHFTPVAVLCSAASDEVPVSPGTTLLGVSVDPDGKLLSTLVVKGAESGITRAVSQATLTLAKGTAALNKDRKPLSEISIAEMASPPASPEKKVIIGLPYQFGPEGATFDPPASLAFSYDRSKLPEGVAEQELTIAYFDFTADKWIELATVVDRTQNTVTAPVSHFTAFAVLGLKQEVTPVVIGPDPSAFVVSSLEIAPAEVNPGENVTVSVMVTNTAELNGYYTVNLRLNDAAESKTDVMVITGDTKKATFNVSKTEPGTYTVDVNGLTGSFRVKRVAGESGPVPGWAIGVSIAFACLSVGCGIAAFIIWRRRTYRSEFMGK